MMEVLNLQQLKRLESHKYSSSGSSITEPMMQIFWKWLVELFPLWIAPNAITIIGLAINVATSLLLMFYCPTAIEVAPMWVYAVNGIGLFVYQALDAIDGKQARRTGSSSPLGELFDHGCDSISTVFVSIAVGISLQLGNHPWVMTVFCLTCYTSFYFGHWCAYVTGTLMFGKVDVTEVQLSTMAIFFITAMFGPGIWSTPLPVLGYPWHTVPVLGCLVGSFGAIVRFSIIILRGGCGENGATVADTSVLSPGLNIGVIVAGALSIASQSKTYLCQNHPVLYLLFVGIIFAKVTNRLVVAHMTRSELHFFDTSLLGMLILFLNQYFGFYLNEYFLLYVCLIYCSVDLLQYLSFTYKQIAQHLTIYIFSIKPVNNDSKAN